jgi:hypothetical protein
MQNGMLVKIVFALSVVAVILAAVVSLFGVHLWLAGTQWILIAILLSVWALFLKK